MPVHPNDHVADLQPRVRGWTVELDTSNERTARFCEVEHLRRTESRCSVVNTSMA